jgi:hypothetical protein
VDSLADFRTDWRMLLLYALAVPIGGIGALVAKALLWSIAVLTNLSFFHRLSSKLCCRKTITSGGGCCCCR